MHSHVKYLLCLVVLAILAVDLTTSQTPSRTRTKTGSISPSRTRTRTRSATVSRTSSISTSITASRSKTATRSPSVTNSPSTSGTASRSKTATRSISLSNTVSRTRTTTVSPSFSSTASRTQTVSRSPSATVTASSSTTVTPSLTPTISTSCVPTSSCPCNYEFHTFVTHLVPPSSPENLKMSMIIQTAINAIYIIDGGPSEEAPILNNYIRNYMGLGEGEIWIAGWIVTHPHSDHILAFMDLMDHPETYGTYTLGTIYSSTWPDLTVCEGVTYPQYTDVAGIQVGAYNRFKAFLSTYSSIWVPLDSEPSPSNIVEFCGGGVRFRFFNVHRPSAYTIINDGSLVFQVVGDQDAKVMVTGDINTGAASRLCQVYNCNAAPWSDTTHLQLAHHGQNLECVSKLSAMFTEFLSFYNSMPNLNKIIWTATPQMFLTPSVNAVLKWTICGREGYEFCTGGRVPLKSNHVFAFCYDDYLAAAVGLDPIDFTPLITTGDAYTYIREVLCTPGDIFKTRFSLPVIA